MVAAMLVGFGLFRRTVLALPVTAVANGLLLLVTTTIERKATGNPWGSSAILPRSEMVLLSWFLYGIVDVVILLLPPLLLAFHFIRRQWLALWLGAVASWLVVYSLVWESIYQCQWIVQGGGAFPRTASQWNTFFTLYLPTPDFALEQFVSATVFTLLLWFGMRGILRLTRYPAQSAAAGTP